MSVIKDSQSFFKLSLRAGRHWKRSFISASPYLLLLALLPLILKLVPGGMVGTTVMLIISTIVTVLLISFTVGIVVSSVQKKATDFRVLCARLFSSTSVKAMLLMAFVLLFSLHAYPLLMHFFPAVTSHHVLLVAFGFGGVVVVLMYSTFLVLPIVLHTKLNFARACIESANISVSQYWRQVATVLLLLCISFTAPLFKFPLATLLRENSLDWILSVVIYLTIGLYALSLSVCIVDNNTFSQPS